MPPLQRRLLQDTIGAPNAFESIRPRRFIECVQFTSLEGRNRFPDGRVILARSGMLAEDGIQSTDEGEGVDRRGARRRSATGMRNAP